MTIALDLGCGASPRNPFDAEMVWGIDLKGCHETHVLPCDLVLGPTPFEDETFDFVSAYDFVEHVPRLIYLPQRVGTYDPVDGPGSGMSLERRYPFVELMNEIWRVLKPGGKFLSYTPAYPHGPAFRDPSHVNIITEETFLYFDDQQGGFHGMAKIYGFKGAFHIESQTWQVPWLVSILTKVEL